MRPSSVYSLSKLMPLTSITLRGIGETGCTLHGEEQPGVRGHVALCVLRPMVVASAHSVSGMMVVLRVPHPATARRCLPRGLVVSEPRHTPIM